MGVSLRCHGLLRAAAPTDRMRKHPVRVVALLALAAILLITFLRPATPQPVCRGKPLGYWVDQLPYFLFLELGHGTAHVELPAPASAAQTDTEVRLAIMECGTNAIPYLLERMTEREGRLHALLRRLLASQTLVRLELPSEDIRRGQALTALRLLGSRATNAVPAIIAMRRSKDFRIVDAGWLAFQSIAPEQGTEYWRDHPMRQTSPPPHAANAIRQ